MRSLIATRLLPPTLRATGDGGKCAAQHAQHKTMQPATTLAFPAHWNNPDVRGVLYARHGRICTYCGRYLPENDRGDVEHFRPKGKVAEDATHGGYWWLAYELTNYLLSCSRCNRVHKKEHFPLRPQARQRVTYATRQQLSREARLLLHPLDLDRQHGPLEGWLQVSWQAANCFLQPQPGLAARLRMQVQGTLEFFRLNLQPRLLQERNSVREDVLEALANADEARVKRFASRFRRHSLVARQMLVDMQRAELLPTPVEELQGFIGEECAILEQTLDLIDQHPNDQRLKQQAQESRWLLAALWRHPPVGTASDVDALLPLPLKTSLQPFAERLTAPP